MRVCYAGKLKLFAIENGYLSKKNIGLIKLRLAN